MKKISAVTLIAVLFTLILCSCSASAKNDTSSAVTAGEVSNAITENADVSSVISNNEIANNSSSEQQSNFLNTSSNISSNTPANTSSNNSLSKPIASNTSSVISSSSELSNTSSKVSGNSSVSNNASLDKQPLVDVANLTPKQIEAFSTQQIEWVHNNAEKFPENFVFEELSGYGRVVTSASSADEAIKQTSDRFTNTSYITTKCNIELETEYFYGLYVKWEPREEKNKKFWHDEKVVCFKKNVCDFQNIVYNNDTDKGTMITKNAELIKRIFDYCYYSQFYQVGGYKVLYSDITEVDKGYNYTVYYIGTVYGDWGVMDEVTLYKQETLVSKNGGAFERSEKEKLKVIEVIGEGFDGGSGNVD